MLTCYKDMSCEQRSHQILFSVSYLSPSSKQPTETISPMTDFSIAMLTHRSPVPPPRAPGSSACPFFALRRDKPGLRLC